ASFYVFNHVPRMLLAPLLANVHRWLVPEGLLLAAFGTGDTPAWTGEWLGTTMFFSSYPHETNSRLVRDAGFALLRDELVTLHELGHAVGLHAVYPRVTRDDRFDAVVAWHNPDPPYVHEAVSGFVNVMQPPWFTKGHYRSDSNQHWREGCPHEELRAGTFEWLQLLLHPEIWVYEGATMRETMHAMLDCTRGRWLGHLANDRIDLA